VKHVPSAFFSAFSAALRIVPQTVFRIRITAVLAILVAGAASLAAHAQTGEWAWMGGSSVLTQHDNAEYGQPGVYGTQGQPSAANIPGGRLGAVSWTDKDGNFWLFGGAGLDSTETFGFLNDLWEFDPSTDEWTWVSGSNTIAAFNGGQPGIYGQQGTPAVTNTPGSRSGALGWTDANGNLWLFGGAGFDAAGTNGNLNDLWEFSPPTSEWTWVGGSSNLDVNGTVAGVYGTLGSLTAGSFPGSRNNAVAWTSKDGSLWLFGGYGGSTPGQFGPLNDLWRYVPSTNQWAWMGGSSTTLQPGVYGQLSTPAPGNVPGARESAGAWVDNGGNFWLFGGTGYALVGEGDLNDLWKFDPTTTEWAWMSGGNSCQVGSICNWPGVYGTLGTAAAGNTPGSRASTVTWTNQDGTLWLFGGNGSDANNVPGFLNDSWKFDPVASEWTWMGGSSMVGAGGATAGVYGTLGTAAAGNLPGSRTEGVAWTDIYGNFWLFGGSGSDAQGTIGYLNDLWETTPGDGDGDSHPQPGIRHLHDGAECDDQRFDTRCGDLLHHRRICPHSFLHEIHWPNHRFLDANHSCHRNRCQLCHKCCGLRDVYHPADCRDAGLFSCCWNVYDGADGDHERCHAGSIDLLHDRRHNPHHFVREIYWPDHRFFDANHPCHRCSQWLQQQRCGHGNVYHSATTYFCLCRLAHLADCRLRQPGRGDAHGNSAKRI
jgi:N-acetylneuraminic acid mutarotase